MKTENQELKETIQENLAIIAEVRLRLKDLKGPKMSYALKLLDHDLSRQVDYYKAQYKEL